jgi:nucleoside-triphosphatase THEP1
MAATTKNDIWLKAAVVGSLWGASEIVLGSFLHNLKIPFSGNMLTAIAIVLMISGHRLWPERGLLIRAGLICAALKTLSPSASILGPMMAIIAQATIMEAVLLAGRRTWAGYLIGGGLAMAWNLFHRILNSIVLYGGTLIELYKSLVSYLVSQTGWETEGYWAPVLALASIFFVTGMIAATAGILISKAGTNAPLQWKVSPKHTAASDEASTDSLPSGWILVRLTGMLLVLIGGIYTAARMPLVVAAPTLLLFLTMVWHYDKRLLRRFTTKRGFWISMGIMLLLSGLLLEKVDNGPAFSITGMQSGLQMMMRAMYVITGFGLISKELRRQSIMQWFETKNMRSFLSAIRIAFQTTPLLIESLPGRQAWRKPARVLASMIGSMEYSLDQVRMMQSHQQTRNQTNNEISNPSPAVKPKFSKVYIITGNKGQGKTTLLSKIIDTLKQNGANVSGILAPELVENEERVGYFVRDIESGEQMVLCREGLTAEERRVIRRGAQRKILLFYPLRPLRITQRTLRLDNPKKIPYVFNPKAVAFGEKCLTTKKGLTAEEHGVIRKETQKSLTAEEHGVIRRGAQRKILLFYPLRPLRITQRPLRLDKQRPLRLKIIDELGPVELKGDGWANAMDHLMTTWRGPMIWVVRESLIGAMQQRWPAESHQVFHVQTDTAETIARTIFAEA